MRLDSDAPEEVRVYVRHAFEISEGLRTQLAAAHSNPLIYEVSVTDTDGLVLASTDENLPGTFLPKRASLSQLVGRSFLHQIKVLLGEIQRAFQDQMFEKSTHKAAFQSAGLPGCVVCHSNHGITHPTDEKLGAGPQADICDQQRAAMLSGLKQLDNAVRAADKVLGVAESSGMEVGQARLDQDLARDALTKARVTIHSFKTELVEQDIHEGLKLAARNLQAGQAALVERDYRCKGLGLALVFILMTVVGLFLYIRQIEQETPKS